MKKRFVTFIILTFIIPCNCICQDYLKDFELFATIERPTDLQFGIPSEILLDSARTMMIIAYDYNPTYLEFYRIKDLKLIKRITTNGHVYLDNSYFYLSENAVYIDKGRNKNKYIKIDLDNYNQEKVSCDEVPLGCPFEKIIDSKIVINEEKKTITTNNSWHVLSYDGTTTQIYLKKNHGITKTPARTAK